MNLDRMKKEARNGNGEKKECKVIQKKSLECACIIFGMFYVFFAYILFVWGGGNERKENE